jgi:hypothetical protein
MGEPEAVVAGEGCWHDTPPAAAKATPAIAANRLAIFLNEIFTKKSCLLVRLNQLATEGFPMLRDGAAAAFLRRHSSF